MKKRRFLLFLFSLSLLLFQLSCAPIAEDVLYYQRSAAEVTGTLYTDTGEFYVKISLSEYDFDGNTANIASDSDSEAAEKALRDAVIVFTYPEEISGYTISVSGGNLTASFGETVFPLGDGAYKRAKEIVSLFMIPEGGLSSVTKKENGTVMAEFGSDGETYVCFDPSGSLPAEIGRGGVILKTDGYFLE